MNEKSFVLSPQAVWGSQLDNLRRSGYQLPAYDEIAFEIPLPDEAKLKLGPALFVDYETPIDKQCQLLGINKYLDLNCHKDLHLKPQGRWGWLYGVEDGKKMLGISPDSCVEKFRRNNRRGLMTVEGLALYRENPDLLKDHYVDLSGSRCDGFKVVVPNLYLHFGVPTLSDLWEGGGDSHWGSASCIRE